MSMDDKFTVVTGGFEALNKFGWCCLSERLHRKEIEIIKKTIEDCGRDYRTAELPNGTIQIFISN